MGLPSDICVRVKPHRYTTIVQQTKCTRKIIPTCLPEAKALFHRGKDE